jgi:hypothetical protein
LFHHIYAQIGDGRKRDIYSSFQVTNQTEVNTLDVFGAKGAVWPNYLDTTAPLILQLMDQPHSLTRLCLHNPRN